MISRRLLAHSVVDRLVDGEPKHVIVQQLAAYIVQHKLHKQSEMIINDIEAEFAERGTVVARVTSATSLTDALRLQLIDFVKSSTEVSQVTLEEKINTSILGGVIVQTSDRMFDASIATKLKRLKMT